MLANVKVISIAQRIMTLMVAMPLPSRLISAGALSYIHALPETPVTVISHVTVM
jgi:hypothetical protein